MTPQQIRILFETLDRIEKRLADLEARPTPYYYQGAAQLPQQPMVWPWPVVTCGPLK